MRLGIWWGLLREFWEDKQMDVLICIGIFIVGALVGAVVMAVASASGYDDVLQDAYDRGFEDARRSQNAGIKEEPIQ